MGFVADWIEQIADVVTDIADAIWNKIREIGNWIEEQIGWINTALIVLTVVSVGIMLPYAIAAYEGAMLSAVIASGGTLAGLDLLTAQAVSFAIALKAGFSAFLIAIHFDVILAVHNIAYLISPHYRAMFQQVINEISRISSILGLGPSFIVLALENARTLVLTVSGLFGMQYDLAQVQWLGIMNNYLKDFAKIAERYRNNPGALLQDMADLIDRPVMDQMGEYMQTLLKTIDRVITGAEEIAIAISTVRRDIDNFIEDMPEFLKREIKPYTDPIIKQIDDFIRYDFTPSIDVIHGVLGILEVRQENIQSRVDNTVERLRYPGRYLQEIDNLPTTQRLDQEYAISEISNRPQRRVYEDIARDGETVETGLSLLRKALDNLLPAPPYLIPEVPELIKKPQIQMDKFDSWFVGDY